MSHATRLIFVALFYRNYESSNYRFFMIFCGKINLLESSPLIKKVSS